MVDHKRYSISEVAIDCHIEAPAPPPDLEEMAWVGGRGAPGGTQNPFKIRCDFVCDFGATFGCDLGAILAPFRDPKFAKIV